MKLSLAKHALHDGDLLLYRGKGLFSRWIRFAGRSPYSHAAMLAAWGDTWMVLEARELRGVRAVTLESQVRLYAGQIDVFTPRGVSQGAVEAMIGLCGVRYSYWGVLEAALLHLPFIRRLVNPQLERENPGRRPVYCSDALAWAYRTGSGRDPVPTLADRYTEPGDLGRSAFFAPGPQKLEP